jgi:glucuronosyltransferase
MKFHDMMNFVYYGIGTSTTEHALQNKRVQDFIQRTNDSFDVIVAEQFYQEAFLMLAHKYKAPFVTVGKNKKKKLKFKPNTYISFAGTFGFAQYMSPLFGVLSPWSHVPHEFLPYSDRMTFFERVESTMLNMFEHYLRQYRYLPMQDDLARKYFSHLPG